MSIQDTFNQTGWSTKRNTPSNTDGDVTDSWSTNLSNIRGRKVEISGSENQNEKGSENNTQTIKFFTDAPQDILEKDQLISDTGEVWDIIQVENPHELDMFLKIIAIRTIDEQEQD